MSTPLQDNAGFNTSPHPGQSQPVAASGQQLTNGTADTTGNVTVEVGKRYRFVATEVGGFIFGMLDPATAANVIWACPIYQTIEIQVPRGGGTTLYYQTNANDGLGYLTEIRQNTDETF